MAQATSTADLAAIPRLSDQLRAEYLEFYRVLPLRIEDDAILVGYWGSEPDGSVLDDLAAIFLLPVRLVEVPADGALPILRKHYGGASSAQELVDRLAAQDGGARTDPSVDDLVALANEAPVIQLVNLLLLEAVEARASDIHLESTARGLRTRYRVDGVLQSAASPPAAYQAPVVSRLKIMAELDIAERRLPQDGRIRLRIQSRDVDVRVSTLPSMHGEDVVLRLLDQSRARLTLTDLGMPDAVRDRFQKLVHLPHGMILVTGPTGSGKTTTLYAAVEEILSEAIKILTVEDPVEYAVSGVTQVTVNTRTGLTFARALRAFLRQDPDVVLVGEIRDPETAEVAAHAALTGHLVLSTLHTRDAVSAVTRLVDLGVPGYLVASTLDAVIAQRLVRRICPHCAGARHVRPEEVVALGGRLERSETVPSAAGCDQCRQTGYMGRVGIYEMFMLDEALRARIAETQLSASHLRQSARDGGYATLVDDGVRLVRHGITTIEEVLRVTAG